MLINTLHIICFDQPYPAVYGGAIDMFYKIKALKRAGVRLILHVFLYREDKTIPQIEKFAYKTYYYKRKLGIKNSLFITPYIVRSRSDKMLLNHLLADDYPILFEGIHTCMLLSDTRLRNRLKMVRTHNVEHSYYRFLADYPNPLWKKLYYRIESLKLRLFERKLRYSDRILAISDSDTKYYQRLYPHKDVRLLRCFFDDTEVPVSQSSKSPYVLYQGNLAVAENVYAIEYILQEIVPGINKDVKFVVAGSNPSDQLVERASKLENVTIFANPDNLQMTELIANAQINLLLTFQPTGVKLKLLTALYKSRGHCIVNKTMGEGTNLDKVCIEACNANDIIAAINENIAVPLSEAQIKGRRNYICKIGYNDIDNIIQQ